MSVHRMLYDYHTDMISEFEDAIREGRFHGRDKLDDEDVRYLKETIKKERARRDKLVEKHPEVLQ